MNRSGEPDAGRVGSLPAGAPLPHRVYSQEFKNRAVRQLGISHKMLNNWIRPQRKIKRDLIANGLEHDDPAALRAHIADL